MKTEFWNWSDVRVFLAVLRQGSTLAASRKLGIAQPTVARRIEALEHQTGLTLFDRDTRGFRPTENARSLSPLAEVIEEAARNFAIKTRELAEQRPIRITAPGYFSDRAMEIFTEFSTLHPEIAIEFVHSIKLLNLAEGEADIAFRVSASEPDESLVCRKIGTEHFALYGGQSYADQFGLPKSLDNLRGHRFVTFKRNDVPDVLHNWLHQHVLPDQIVATFSEIDLMYSSIKAGNGLGLVHARWADTQDTLLRCFGNIEELSRPVTMLIAPDAYRRQEVKAFTKFFAPRYAAIFR
ncbi:HTH-type transcriptional regulator DmlR [Defluviimonas aquaemixtae]|uniref:HTH-type transcriptional regulator DmlR n=1 Tax=Albidovulum aquaemixtae TaxID=1542388 RepID=A0A2R8B355_9RHOB|nr:LysR family transcriptional regulator [Defluviimonas aquaemixtae]SPH16923.1 HTH-type transcriptional regulator DmlR [Defluviimonas aquaemixtae]